VRTALSIYDAGSIRFSYLKSTPSMSSWPPGAALAQKRFPATKDLAFVCRPGGAPRRRTWPVPFLRPKARFFAALRINSGPGPLLFSCRPRGAQRRRTWPLTLFVVLEERSDEGPGPLPFSCRPRGAKRRRTWPCKTKSQLPVNYQQFPPKQLWGAHKKSL
jgi:hypothetical protein